jgi:hypothetical protein
METLSVTAKDFLSKPTVYFDFVDKNEQLLIQRAKDRVYRIMLMRKDAPRQVGNKCALGRKILVYSRRI